MLKSEQGAEIRTPVKEELRGELKRRECSKETQTSAQAHASVLLRRLRKGSDARMELLRACGGARVRGHPLCAAAPGTSINSWTRTVVREPISLSSVFSETRGKRAFEKTAWRKGDTVQACFRTLGSGRWRNGVRARYVNHNVG